MIKANRRKFVQFLLVIVHILTIWVTVSSLTWMYELGLENLDPITAGVAMGIPAALIGAMFKVCQQYLAEYSKSGVELEAKRTRTELELTGKLVEKSDDDD